MKLSEYQELAARTINPKLSQHEKIIHAMAGMMSELGEMASLYQKVYQGHEFDIEHLFKECGDLLWFMAELHTAYGRQLGVTGRINIDKLKARYPEGFTVEKSLHRKEGDI